MHRQLVLTTTQPQLVLVRCDDGQVEFTTPTGGIGQEGSSICGPDSCINPGGPVANGTPLRLAGNLVIIKQQPTFSFIS